MELSDQEIIQLRDSILEAAQKMPRGIPTVWIKKTIEAMMFELPDRGADSLESHILHLERAGLLEKVTNTHTPSYEVWKLTAAGDDHLRTKFRAK